ncbi:MAG: TonB-dependent receptor [Acidobacteriia bacterium]|nr:TonB-dependent receptor [Terriglobia bacterium]
MRPIVHLALLLSALPLLGQSNSGELRLKVTDPAGLSLKATVELSSDSTQFRRVYQTDDAGILAARNLPFGLYRLHVEHEGFSSYEGLLEIRSALPTDYLIRLSVAAMSTAINVTAERTLLDPDRTSTINRIDSRAIADRTSALPGRSLPDLVNSQPGWVYEGSAVLHPRGSEYQTQFVVDGVPLTDNRAPSNGPEIEADDVESLTVYTAGIPAEYGRKMGGVVEVDTTKDDRAGLHGKAALSGGSFGTASAYLLGQYGWGKNVLGLSADGALTDRYLNPPVTGNYTNTATTSDFAARYDRDFSNHDRLGISLRRELSKFLVPNEQIQEAAGQRQHRDVFETLGILSYQHIFSESLLADLRFMVRSDTDALSSSPQSTPIVAFQDRGFREQYLKGTASYHRGRHEFKAGFEADFTHLREGFDDVITCQPEFDPFCPFDPGTPAAFTFSGSGLDLEQSAFIQDLIRLGKWTVSAGLRWDHYQLRVNQNAVSPRLGVARFFPAVNMVLHASYDRVFQTPAFENILLASSPAVTSLDPLVLRLPVEPSHGNYYEVGVTKAFADKLKIDVNVFGRDVNNFADDDQLLNTSVSFPIAFRKARIYGAESKLELPQWRRFSGFLSYSYIVGSVYLPVTGGFFLGSDATTALSQTNGRFWDSQDQRNTLHGRLRYQLTSRAWIALSGEYGSGLPIAVENTPQEIQKDTAQYGQAIVDRVNFARGRVKPSLSLDASAGADLWQHDQKSIRLQGAVQNFNNRLNLIDFAGLFSGNAVAPPRSYSLRLQTTF